MSQDQSLAVVENQALTLDAVPQILTERQTVELEQYQDQLQKLQRPIAATQEELGYLWLEAGLYLLKVRELIPSVSRETDGQTGKYVTTQEGQRLSFESWVARPEIGYSRATAYRYMQGARNCGLTAESTFQDIIALKTENRLAGVTPPKFGRTPNRGRIAAEIVQPSEPAQRDFEFEWECYLARVRKFYEEWAYYGSKCVCEDLSWVELKESEIEVLQNTVYGIYRTLTEHIKKAKDRKQLIAGKNQETKPKADKKTQPPPESDRLPDFEFQKPRGSRKLKGSRWFYGHQTPDGKIVLTVYKGKESEADAEAFKKTMPAVTLVGPFYSTSLRYAKEKVKQVLSGKPLDTSFSKKIEGETILVP